MDVVTDLLLLAFLVVTALAMLRIKNLFAAAMLFSIYSLLTAGVFVVLDAIDVAFTEAAVGAGVSTILMLGTLSVIGRTEDRSHRHALAGVLVVLVTATLLVYASLDMPRLGDPAAPAHNHVAPRYLHQSGEEIGIPNVVTSVLASYRGYDTLGEVTVIFTAGVGVLCLLGGRRRRRRAEQGKP